MYKMVSVGMYHVPLLYVQMRKKFLDGSHTHMHKRYLGHSKIQVEDNVFPSIPISQQKSFFLCMRASSYDIVCVVEKRIELIQTSTVAMCWTRM